MCYIYRITLTFFLKHIHVCTIRRSIKKQSSWLDISDLSENNRMWAKQNAWWRTSDSVKVWEMMAKTHVYYHNLPGYICIKGVLLPMTESTHLSVCNNMFFGFSHLPGWPLTCYLFTVSSVAAKRPNTSQLSLSNRRGCAQQQWHATHSAVYHTQEIS